MPITRRNGKYYWGRQGPFDTQAKAEEVAQAAYASGYKGSVQKLMNLVQKADDGPPEYHPITGQRINAPTSGGRMGPNLTPSHIGGELEQQAFPDIHNWYDNIQSQAHLSPKEQNLYVPGVPMTPKKYKDVLTPQRMPLAGQEMGVHHDVEGKPSHEKDHSLLVEAELGHDKVDDERAGSQWVPGRFIGRPTHDGAYHQGFAHMVLDELYGRTHHGYNHGFNDLSAQMGSEYEGKYRDVYSHHPHNEHLDDLGGETTGEVVNPLNKEPLNLKTMHGMGEDKSNRNVDNPILDNIPGSLTDSHKSTFGRKEGWAWTNHGLFQRAIKRGEKMRFSTWLLGFALGAEHINANNDVPYGFNSFGNRISPSSHSQDIKVSSDLHRPVKWEDKDGQILANKPLLHYRLPHSMDRSEEQSVRQLDTHFLPPGLQTQVKMGFLDDFGPMDIHQALDLIENPNHDVDPGRVQMTRIDPSTGAKIEDAFPRLRNPMNYRHVFENTEEGKANQRPGDLYPSKDYDWDAEHTRNYFGNGLNGRLFGNFLPEQDALSRYAQLQYHDGLRGLWNTENPETGGDVYTEEDYANRGMAPWMTYHPRTGQRNFPLRKAPYFVNPADPFGRGKEDKPSQQGGGYGDEVKDVLSSPNIASDPMAEFAPKGRQERQPQFHRPWGINYHASGTWPNTTYPNAYSGDEEVARAQQFQLKPPAPLKGGPGGHLASEPLHYDNASGTSDKREFDRYLHKLSNGEKMPHWEHWLGLVRGADYHNHNAAAINNFMQDEAQYRRLGHFMRRVDEDRDMGILGQDRSTESIEYPHIVINRGTIPRNDHSYHSGKTFRQLAPSEKDANPNAPETSSGGQAFPPYSAFNDPIRGPHDDAAFALNSAWHHGTAIEPPENTPTYGIPWPFHNIRGTSPITEETVGMNISQEDMYNPEVKSYTSSSESPDDWGEVDYQQHPMTLKAFLSLSGPQLQQGIENHKFQGHPWVEGESPLTTDTTGEPGILHTKGENKDWDNLLDARWKAWVSYLNHVLEHEPDHTAYFGPEGESDPPPMGLHLQKLFQLQKLSQLCKMQKAEEDDGIEGFRRRMGDEIQRQVDKNRPHTEWEDTHPDLFLPVGHDKAPLFLEPEEKGGQRVPSVHYHAYNYVDKIHRDVPMTANQHADGLKRVHRSDMLQRRGDAVRDMDYDDAFPLGRAMPKIPPRNAPKGQRPSQEYLDTTRKEMNIHDFLTDHTESMLSKVPSQHQEGIQRMFKKVAFESPSYKPTGSFETDPDIQQYFAIENLQKFIRKEGDGGGAFNGLSDTVFTSTNAGIFSPTYGGSKTQKRHEKRHKAQEKKRKKLLGKDKKSGVDRLVTFLYDGSPNMSKARKMGLAPGLDDDMTGDGATAHAWNNQATGPMRLNWKKDMSEDTLNHKKTSRPLEDALKTAENNEPHINMGLAGGMETGTTSTYPRHDSVNSVGNAQNPRAANWGKHKAYVQKAVNEGTTMTSPTENKPWSLDEPQDKFVERAGDNPNEPPAKDAVTKENDMQRRVKKYDDKASRRDGGIEQPAGSMAAAGSAGYPSGAAMQMAYTSDYGRADSLHRGGEEDMEDPEVVANAGNDASTYWVPEAEKVAKLEAMRKALEEAGDETPILNALLKVDYA